MTTLTRTVPNDLAEAVRTGELDDYRAGPPWRTSFTDIDVEVCQAARCPNCGHVGLECRQFHREGSYRAFAVCPNCGASEEF